MSNYSYNYTAVFVWFFNFWDPLRPKPTEVMMDDMRGPQKVKPKHLKRHLVAGCSVG